MTRWKLLLLLLLKWVKIRRRANEANPGGILSRRSLARITYICFLCPKLSHWLVIKLPPVIKSAYKASPYWTAVIQPWDASQASCLEYPPGFRGPCWVERSTTVSQGLNLPVAKGLIEALGINSSPFPLFPPCRKLLRRAMSWLFLGK